LHLLPDEGIGWTRLRKFLIVKSHNANVN